MEKQEIGLEEDEEQNSGFVVSVELQLWRISNGKSIKVRLSSRNSSRKYCQTPTKCKLVGFISVIRKLYEDVPGFPLPVLCVPTFYLITLNLNECQLTTIECISSFQMPNMTSLDLSNNFITTCRSLRKATFPNLHSIFLQENLVRDIKWLSEMRIRSQFFALYIEEFYSQALVDDLTPIAKLQPTIRKLYIESQERMKRPSSFWRKLTQMSAQYPHLKIYKYANYGAM